MWLDDSNRGGGEPPQGHPPIINVQEVAFIDVALSLPGFMGVPDHGTAARFGIGFCGHGALVVDVQGVVVLPLPRHATFRRRLVYAMNYLLGRITAPPPAPTPEAPTDGA